MVRVISDLENFVLVCAVVVGGAGGIGLVGFQDFFFDN